MRAWTPFLLAALLPAFLDAPPARGAGAPAAAQEISATYRDAMSDFLGGRYGAAASGYKYLLTLGLEGGETSADLALMMRESGDPEAAAAQWLKATLVDPENAFLWNQRGWNYLALGRFREARDSFRKAAETAKGPDDAGEASLGLGMADAFDGNHKAAIEPLRRTVDKDPYLRPLAAAELGRVQLRLRHYPEAANFLELSLGHDRAQAGIARALGTAYEKTGQAKPAWRAFKLSLDLDPGNEDAVEEKKDLEKYIEGRPEDSLPVVRLARPMFRGPGDGADEDAASEKIRVALFTGSDGRPRHVQRFYIMGSTATRFWDVKIQEEAVQPAEPFRQWEVVYRTDSRVIEIRDTRGAVIYVTKQPFRFEPLDPRFTLLVKNPELTDIRGIDISDRELRGVLEVIPTPDGFHLVNEIPLESYLLSVVGENLPPRAPPDAYKALAVFTRTKVRDMVRRARRAPPNPEKTQLCDSAACIVYMGLGRERAAATEGVRATRGKTIALPRGRGLDFHRSCGWTTVDGVQDRPPPPRVLRSAYGLEKLIHGYPDPALYHQASAVVPETWNRWARLFEIADIRERAERIRDIGPVRRVRVLERDPTGRVQGIELTGSRGSLKLIGWKGMEAVLGPGSVPSTLFSIQPIYRGKKIKKLLIWGAGTGSGKGLCLAGTLGQAHSGRDYCDILFHYFSPAAKVPGCVYKPPVKPRAAVKKKPVKKRAYRPRRPARHRRRHRPRTPAKTKKPRPR